MKNKIDELKLRTIFSSILTLMPILIGIAIWDRIPNSLLPNSSITTQINTPIYKLLLVFGIPIVLLIVNLICLRLTYKDNLGNNQSKKILNSIFYICPFISIVSCITFYNGIMGNDFNATRLTPFLFGILFILLGNNLPKAKPNSTYGVKTYWALKNNKNWRLTHKFSAYVFVIGGLVCLFLPALPLNYIIPTMIGLFVILSVLPVVYSFVYHKVQIKNGTYVEDGVLKGKRDKTQKIKLCIVISVISIILISIMTTGNIDVVLESNDIAIDTSYYTDIKIPYAKIEHIEYREHKNIGNRLVGFSSFKLSLGTFSNDEFDTYTCYMYNNTNSCIAIKTSDGDIILNLENDKSTLELYEDIKNKL